MSARNFSVNLEKKPHPAGDRVVVLRREVPALRLDRCGHRTVKPWIHPRNKTITNSHSSAVVRRPPTRPVYYW